MLYNKSLLSLVAVLLLASANAVACSNAPEAATDLPDDPMAVFEMGTEKAKSGDAEAAKVFYEKAVSMDPRIGDALAAKGRYRDAVASYEIALTSAPEDPITHHKLGIALMNVGSPDKAVEHMSRAVQIDPEYAVALHDLGLAYMHRGKNEEALKWLKMSLEKDPNYFDSHRDISKVYKALGRQKEAAEHRSQARAIASMPEENKK